jgi:hypothetical protein
MVTMPLPPDFKEFLKLLNESRAEYLLIGGYAVGYYGYPRTTGDLDVWVAHDTANPAKVAEVLYRFGFCPSSISADDLAKVHRLSRFGILPLRIEFHTSISGVEFAECFARRVDGFVDGMPASLIRFEDLKANKRASGRLKDLVDLENLPD